jgi:hypothetical protein
VNADGALDPVDQKEFIDKLREHPNMINLPTNKSLQETFREEGELIGTIRTLQEVLGDEVSPKETLTSLSMSKLKAMQTWLKKRMKSRS